jgi:hypothetical protein
MKINPKLQLNIAFWAVTLPVVPFVVIILLLSVVIGTIPGIGNKVLDKVERLITKFAVWRNNIPFIKNAYDKVHLFDYIKNSN